jgi:hypothetical protein
VARDRIVPSERGLHARGLRLPQTGAALDVAEQESQDAVDEGMREVITRLFARVNRLQR